jgi:hypothetical protein
VAGVTGHFQFVVEVPPIDFQPHLHHFPRVPFFLLIVLVQLVFNVAELAIHAQRGADKLHRWNQLLRRNIFQNLYILELLRCCLWRSTSPTLAASWPNAFCKAIPHAARATSPTTAHTFAIVLLMVSILQVF